MRVTMAAPVHTMTKTAAKTKDPESPGAVMLKMEESNRHTRRGPQRSPRRSDRRYVSEKEVEYIHEAFE